MSTPPEPPTGTTTVSLMDPRFVTDPYTLVAELRERGAALRAGFLDGSEVWLFPRDAEVRTILSDPRFAVDPSSVPGRTTSNARLDMAKSMGMDEDILLYLNESMLDRDPPDHTRLRRLVSRAFTVRRVSELRPRVERITEELLTALPGRAENGTVDLIEHFAYPLPITVICELVGVSVADRPLWRQWAQGLFSMNPESMNQAMRAMVDHIREMIERRRAEPSDDLLDALVRVSDTDGDRLTETELITMVFLLVLAGHETTAHLIGNGTLALLTHPDQFALLREDPGWLPAAVHEIQRWCGPILMPRLRYAKEDLELGGVRIAAGEPLQALLVGANRDPRHFPEPDRFDITRRPSGRGEQHVGFGHGAHYCLGAALARQEAEVAFGGLVNRYPDLTLAVAEGELEWETRPGMRRLRRLPLRL